MIFKDEVEIEIHSGKGGDGSASFRREKYVPKGGPDGGDGGNGGNVVLRVSGQLRTLSHIHNRQHFKAGHGEEGRGSQCHGKKGTDCVIEVPPGTVVFEADKKKPVADLTEDGSEFIAAKGGRGGLGNVHFKSSTNQTPFYAKQGKPGEAKSLRLELKLIAHVGLVGFPNAGKSTLISRITNARPKIANYPFTTLEPNLGVMTVDDAYTSILIADIPGLITGAHEGKGLGIEFLKHIERTKLILYILDATDEPTEKFKILQQELKGYSGKLAKRDYLIALNKTDRVPDPTEMDEIAKAFSRKRCEVLRISALTGAGLKELKIALYRKYVEIEKRDEDGSK